MYGLVARVMITFRALVTRKPIKFKTKPLGWLLADASPQWASVWYIEHFDGAKIEAIYRSGRHIPLLSCPCPRTLYVRSERTSLIPTPTKSAPTARSIHTFSRA